MDALGRRLFVAKELPLYLKQMDTFIGSRLPGVERTARERGFRAAVEMAVTVGAVAMLERVGRAIQSGVPASTVIEGERVLLRAAAAHMGERSKPKGESDSDNGEATGNGADKGREEDV